VFWELKEMDDAEMKLTNEAKINRSSSCGQKI
jgi:hypothetical protein